MNNIMFAGEPLDEPKLWEIDEPPENDPHWHHNCKSVVMTYKVPSAKEYTLDIMKLEMERHFTKWWQFKKRLDIQAEINKIIICARSYGYFEVKK